MNQAQPAGESPMPAFDGGLEEPDPFEAFNAAMGGGVIEDPYPGFALARALGGMQGVEGFSFDGQGTDDTLDAHLPDMPGLFTAFSFDAVQQVLRDGTAFSSSAYALVMGPVLGRSILEMDEPEHHKYRSLIQQAFTKRAMERWERELVAPVVHAHIDRFADRGNADLVRELTFPFPLEVIAKLFGLPEADLPWFHRRAVEVIAVNVDNDKALAASAALRDYFAVQLADRRRHPGRPDMLSVLAEAEHLGERLTDEEIFAFCRLLLPAGAETTYRSSSNLLVGLLSDPTQLQAVRADRTLIPQAIEEGLRWEPPLLMILRTAAIDTEVCGVAVSAGSAVITNMGSANHDETRWADPERFDIFRESKPHAAFAYGPHTCLGMHLARMETHTVLTALLDRLPNLRLDPSAPPPQISGMTFRSPAAIRVVWDT